MSPFLCAIFLLCISTLATEANINQVYAWDELDYEWPSEANRTQYLRNGTFNPEHIEPHYMAVYGSRLFLSLMSYFGTPATLVSLLTSSASFAPPKLTPFPSWKMNGKNDCNKIEEAAGLQVDSVGRLWVLDSGSDKCKAKLWLIELINNDHTELIHRFSFRYNMHDLVLDETANGTFAYISRWNKLQIVVFSLERKKSWMVKTLQTRVFSIALSPKHQEPRQLYLGKWNSTELYSIPVAALHSETQTANPKKIGNWNTFYSYRMLIDNYGTMYSAFLYNRNIESWNTSQPFQKESYLQVPSLHPNFVWPFSFALDQNGTFWMTLLDEEKKPRLRLLKDAVGVENRARSR